MEKFVSCRLVYLMSLLFVGTTVVLLSQCRTTTSKNRSDLNDSAVSSTTDNQIKTFNLVGEKGQYKVLFPNSKRELKSGESVLARYGVVQKRAGDSFTCDALPNKKTVKLKLDGNSLVFDLSLENNAFEVCTDSGNEGRKLSLKCQRSGDWDGPKMLELCLKTQDGTEVFGRTTPSTDAKTGFGLNGQTPHEDDVLNYGKVCAERLGSLPRDWSCLDGEIIPITVNGVELGFNEHKMQQKCDKPPYLGLGEQGQCIPYARLGRLKTGPNVETVFICRRYNIFKPEIDPSTGEPKISADGETVWSTNRYGIEENAFQDVAIVQHNIKTGESCFFQALSGFRGDKDLPTTRIPPPDEETVPADIVDRYTKTQLVDGQPNPNFVEKQFWPEPAQGFWIKPSAPNPSGVPGRGFECTICHDSDAYMHSPYVDQLNYSYPKGHVLEGLVDKMVPCNPADPKKFPNNECLATVKGLAKGKMSLVHESHQKWKPAFHIAPKDDDTCVRCHRVGSINTCSSWVNDSVGGNTVMTNDRTTWSKTFPESHWMPISSEFMKDWKSRSCKPNMADPANPENCSMDLVKWRQTFEEGTKNTEECCNMFLNGDPDFSNKCTSTPITEAPPATGGRENITLSASSLPVDILDFDRAAYRPKVTNIPLAVPEIKTSGNVSHIKITMRIDHDRHTNLKVILRKDALEAMVYDGQIDGYPSAGGELNISTNSADDQGRFASILGTDVNGNWSIEIKDTKIFETGVLTAVEAVVSYD